jgi:hypothetical protein
MDGAVALKRVRFNDPGAQELELGVEDQSMTNRETARRKKLTT